MDRDQLDNLLVSRFGLTSDELGIDDDMLSAGWCGFDSVSDFVDSLEEEHIIPLQYGRRENLHELVHPHDAPHLASAAHRDHHRTGHPRHERLRRTPL